MTNIPAIRDVRALSMPSVPYSAYCRVCWIGAYVLWMDEDHGGVCPWNHARAQDCPEAQAEAFNTRQLKRALAGLPPDDASAP